MSKIPAFAWPPGWLEKGTKGFVSYDGAADVVLAASPNFVSMTKVNVGIYDVVFDFPLDSIGIICGYCLFPQDLVAGVPLVFGYLTTGYGTGRITIVDNAGAPIDALISFLKFSVPEGWAVP